MNKMVTETRMDQFSYRDVYISILINKEIYFNDLPFEHLLLSLSIFLIRTEKPITFNNKLSKHFSHLQCLYIYTYAEQYDLNDDDFPIQSRQGDCNNFRDTKAL